MGDRIAERNQAAETDAAEENGPAAKLVDQQPEHCDLILLADKEAWLVGRALAEQVEGRDAQPPCHQRRAVAGPQLRILREPVDEHIGRAVLGTLQLVAYPIGAVGEK